MYQSIGGNIKKSRNTHPLTPTMHKKQEFYYLKYFHACMQTQFVYINVIIPHIKWRDYGYMINNLFFLLYDDQYKREGREGVLKLIFTAEWQALSIVDRRLWSLWDKLGNWTGGLHCCIVTSIADRLVLGGRCHHLNSSTICKQVHSKFLTLALFANKSIHVHTFMEMAMLGWKWNYYYMAITGRVFRVCVGVADGHACMFGR